MSDTDSNQPPLNPSVMDWINQGGLTRSMQQMVRPASWPQPQPAPQPMAVRQPAPQPERPLDIRPPAATETPEERPPQRDVQAYTPSRPVKFKDWGDDPWVAEAMKHNPELVYTSHAPTPRESYAVAHGAGRSLAEYAAPEVAGPARIAAGIAGILTPVMDYVSGGAFSPAFGKSYGTMMKGRMDEMKMRREYYEMERDRMIDAQEQAYENQKHMIWDYKEVFELLGNHLISEDEARNRIRDLNTKYRHGTLQRKLDSGDLAAVQDYIEWEKGKANDLYNSAQSLRASDRRRKEAAGVDPDAATLDKELDRDKSRRGVTSTGEPRIPREGDAEKEKEDMPEKDTYDEYMANKPYKLSNMGIEWAHQKMRTGELPKASAAELKTGINVLPRVESAAAEGTARINKIKTDKDMSPDEKYAAIQQIDPVIADDFRDLANYDKQITDIPQKMRGFYEGGAKSLNPAYGKISYDVVKRMSNPDSQQHKTVVRFSGAAQNMSNIFSSLKGMDENASIPKNRVMSWVQANFTGDPQYSTLARQMFEWSQVSNSIQTLSGVPRVTLTEHLDRLLPATASPRQIRAALQQDLADAWSHYKPYQDDWNKTGKKGLVPGMGENAAHVISSFLRMNPNTGQVPEDPNTLPQVMGASKDPSKASRRLKDEEKYPPPTITDMKIAKQKLDSLKDNRSPEAEWQKQQLRAIIGPIVDGPWDMGY